MYLIKFGIRKYRSNIHDVRWSNDGGTSAGSNDSIDGNATATPTNDEPTTTIGTPTAATTTTIAAANDATANGQSEPAATADDERCFSTTAGHSASATCAATDDNVLTAANGSSDDSGTRKYDYHLICSSINLVLYYFTEFADNESTTPNGNFPTGSI